MQMAYLKKVIWDFPQARQNKLQFTTVQKYLPRLCQVPGYYWKTANIQKGSMDLNK